MLVLYLFCLVVGGGLLLVSLFGADGDADPHGGVEIEADGLDAPPGEMADADGWVHAGEWGVAREFLSVRSLFYFLAGFGATGLLMEALTSASPGVAAAWALIAGMLGAGAAGTLYALLRRSESGRVPTGTGHLLGQPARVVLPVVHGRRGKVRAVVGGREVEFLARLYGAEEPECPRGATVVIVDLDGETALVTPAPSLPSDPS